MTTIQIVLEHELLRAADRAARKRRVNRSALFREALRAHLKRLAVDERELRDRQGYSGSTSGDFRAWDRVAAWPDE